MNNEIGVYLGLCNRRSACTENNAEWFNSSTKKYYCAKCAALINRANPEVKSSTGIDLCIKITACTKSQTVV